MNDADRWQELERIFHEALTLPPEERKEYLRAACEDDQELRNRVESLLRQDTDTQVCSVDGQRIGPYKVLSKLGSGGMGEVYLAHDTRLGRQVALKILPQRFASDPERRNRFLRETKLAATFNHPNIVSVYDVGTEGSLDYLVMEYVRGKPLDQVIPPDGLKIRRALSYAIQIAEALQRAHAAGIIHRDLKPSNVLITEDNVAKVLDFGIAKHVHGITPLTTETQEGAIVGTAAYMSPEQAEGKHLDARSDIFSFGSVLYEMLTGRRAFHRESTASTLAAVLNDQPAQASALADDVPDELSSILGRCLQKAPANRFQKIADVKGELKSIVEEIEARKHIPARNPARWRHRSWIFAGLASLLVVIIGAYSWLNRNTETPQKQSPSGPTALTTYPGDEVCPSFSPDGTSVVFARNPAEAAVQHSENFDIYIKTIGSDESVRLTSNPADEFSPAWSPDGRYIAFVRVEGPERLGVFLIPPIGGRERRIAQVSFPLNIAPYIGSWLSWSSDSESLAIVDRESPSEPPAIFVLSIGSGDKHRLTSPPPGAGDGEPSISQDSHTLLFVRTIENSLQIYHLNLIADLRPHGQPARLVGTSADSSSPAWAPDGKSIIFGRGSAFNNTLWSIERPGPGSRSGQPERLTFAGLGAWQPAISKQGRLAYTQMNGDVDIWRIHVNGAKAADSPPVRLISSTSLDHDMRYSPDGRNIAFASSRSGSHEIWICDNDGSNPILLTNIGGPYYTAGPQWSPDGKTIAFSSNVVDKRLPYLIPSAGGKAKRFDSDAVDGWSRDGKYVYVKATRSGSGELFKMPVGGGNLIGIPTKSFAGGAFESKDGKYLYYMTLHGSIQRLELQKGGEVQMLPSVANDNFAVASTGIYFVPGGQSSAIQFLNFADGKIATVLKLPRSPLFGFSLSPDEKWLLYTQYEDRGSNLMLVENYH